MTDRCPFTGRNADECHHPTGRGPDGRYLDPAWTIPLSRAQHVAEHVAWRIAGLDRADGNLIALRLRRTGHLFVRLADHVGDGTIALSASSVRALGHLLLNLAGEVDP